MGSEMILVLVLWLVQRNNFVPYVAVNAVENHWDSVACLYHG